MSPEQRMVKEFHEKYGAPVGDKPAQIGVKDRLRRARLIVSEAAEFLDAADTGDFVEMVDALADILVVTYGAAVEMGVDLEPVFAEVQRSNMSKNGGKDAGGKILKGPGFLPPDIPGELRKQGYREDNAECRMQNAVVITCSATPGDDEKAAEGDGHARA
ncbi:MAG: nucleoside triphosphate pyrophosphohydrolase family protein [Phycisphaerae bacterium]|nr:nucleoside triphosphate pyrophosphohydrolase family protein [Phycisphaerae bacterium]